MFLSCQTRKINPAKISAFTVHVLVITEYGCSFVVIASYFRIVAYIIIHFLLHVEGMLLKVNTENHKFSLY